MSDENQVGGSPAAAGETGAAAPSTQVGSGTPATPPAGAGTSAAEKQYTYREDRSNWVPSHVVRERTQELEKYRRELEVERQRVAALSGVKPPTPPRNPEFDAIRNQLLEVAPELKEIFEIKDKLKELTGLDLEEIKAIRDSQTQSWSMLGNQVLNQIEAKVKALYGGADLSPKAIQRVQRMFVSEVESDPELAARYSRGDTSLIDEFVNDIRTGILDPFGRTRQAAAAPAQRAAARLPRGGGSTAIAPPRPPSLKPSDGEAYHKAAFSRFTTGD